MLALAILTATLAATVYGLVKWFEYIDEQERQRAHDAATATVCAQCGATFRHYLDCPLVDRRGECVWPDPPPRKPRDAQGRGAST